MKETTNSILEDTISGKQKKTQNKIVYNSKETLNDKIICNS